MKYSSVPGYSGDLAGFAGMLRKRIFSSQAKAAAYFGLNRTTVVRYENEALTPPLGYLAALAQLAVNEQKPADVATCQQQLLQHINQAVRYDYRDEPFESWAELCAVADDYLSQQRAAKKKSALNGRSTRPAPSVLPGNFIRAAAEWSQAFFNWPEAPAHLRSSWAGMVIYTLSVVTGYITPRGVLILVAALVLWMLTAWLIAPILQWPLDDAAVRQAACLKVAAAVIIPILTAAVTRPDEQNKFRIDSLKRRFDLWLLKITGAVVGFNTFLMIVIGAALIWYYLPVPPINKTAAAILAAVPLFFSYVVARRTPVDRYKMFNGHLRLHRADWLFLTVFTGIGPLMALFLCAFYGVLADKITGSITLVLVAAGLALWEYKKQKSR